MSIDLLVKPLRSWFWSLDLIPQNIKCRIYNNAAISIPNNPTAAQGTLTFNSERYDTDSMHSTSSNTSRITFNTAGTYDLDLNIRWASNTTGYRQAYFRMNGTTIIAMDHKNPVNGDVTTQSLSTQYDFVVGDYIEVIVFQNSGGSLNVDSAGNYSPEVVAHRQL
jgi:hypothetical protein